MQTMQPMHTIPARGGLNFDETPFSGHLGGHAIL